MQICQKYFPSEETATENIQRNINTDTKQKTPGSHLTRGLNGGPQIRIDLAMLAIELRLVEINLGEARMALPCAISSSSATPASVMSREWSKPSLIVMSLKEIEVTLVLPRRAAASVAMCASFTFDSAISVIVLNGSRSARAFSALVCSGRNQT